MRCFTCKSENVKKLDAIISQGTKEIDLGHGFLGLGASKSGMSIGGAKGKSKGTIKDGLASRLERHFPQRPSKLYILSLITVGFFIFNGLLTYGFSVESFIMISFLVVVFYEIFKRKKKKEKKYEIEKEECTRTWYCFKCNKLTLQGKRKKI